KAASDEFDRVNRMPDASEHSNRVARYLAEIEDEARADIMHTLFGSSSGVLYPSYTASQINMEMIRIISEHARGTNCVTTVLEHPSAFDAMTVYSEKYGRRLRVAQTNHLTGGVDEDAVISLIDRDTAILCCMAASNISGCIFPTEEICRRAREINPDIYIIVDAVQHAPHGALDPEKAGADVMVFAPYKFFGVRGVGMAYLSDRASRLPHSRLSGKPENDWEIGSPPTPHFAAVKKIIDYVVEIGSADALPGAGRRELFENGMKRIADHERALLYAALEGDGSEKGLRHLDGVHVRMDGCDLTKRDFIIGIEFDNMSCTDAVAEYDRRGIVVFDRSSTSIYSKRMLDAFGLDGVVRISPLHVNSVAEINSFLRITREISEM
ncbi:MAG: aminotransferase class V-fold PLP-dependent enzyme, partial [Clostridia bacterium]|nr:aminotransferase class V-fold PLP-dependent enzyme [Clostridia bacterium]